MAKQGGKEMNASMIDGHTDDGYYNSITIGGVNIGCRAEAINNHVCENCLHLHHTRNGICTCDKTCYDAAVVVRGIPTSQYFWCKGNLHDSAKDVIDAVTKLEKNDTND
jgi:hypothetical protein